MKICSSHSILKKGWKDLVKNYRPISPTSLLVKTLKRLMYSRIFGFIGSNNLLSSHQYGFPPAYSCTSQLIHLFHEWAKAPVNASLPIWYFWTSKRPSIQFLTTAFYSTRTLWNYRLNTFLVIQFSPWSISTCCNRELPIRQSVTGNQEKVISVNSVTLF